MSTIIRVFALLAISGLFCLTAADLSTAPLAVYYSFDTAAQPRLLTQIQAELDTILAPSGVRATWRSSAAPRDGSEVFPGIVVFRYHGNCSFDGVSSVGNGSSPSVASALAESQTVDGHVLPFGSVDCNLLRRFLTPAARTMTSEERNRLLGRALARVTAHEIFHMLTGTETHASHGIFRATHSRADLTAETFAFAKPEAEWLRNWVHEQAPPDPLITAGSGDTQIVTQSAEQHTTDSDGSSFGGR